MDKNNSETKENITEDMHHPQSVPVDENDKTFDRLRGLQILLKKESALRELCKFLF